MYVMYSVDCFTFLLSIVANLYHLAYTRVQNRCRRVIQVFKKIFGTTKVQSILDKQFQVWY
jgi:hypothetical protein